ncbi:MAG: SLC13 family permease, partial [bacterium]|nr:SLC13 family permease [bacterium]
PVGIAMLAASIIFMATLGRRLLPARMPEGAMPPVGTRRDLLETYRLHERLFRVRVERGDALDGKTIAQASLGESFGMTVLAVERDRKHTPSPPPGELLQPGDMLTVQARPEEIERLRSLGPIAFEPEWARDRGVLENDTVGLAEVVVAPRSDLAGKSLKELEFRQRYGVNVVAVWRAGQPRRAWLADLPLQHGDALLLQGPRERIRSIEQEPDFVSLDESPPLRTAQVPYALLALGAVILSGATGVVPVSLAAVLAAGIVIIGGCVSVTEAPQVVDWPTIIVVGSLLPLGAALHTTGAAAAVAGAVLPLAGDAPFTVLAAICLATFVIGQFVPAIPTTILMAPIALSAATEMGVNPVPFMITVAAATSVTLLTPISHPVSMMVMVPGGYRFGDYARVGAPLALLLGVTLLAVVVAVWQF